VIDFRGINYPRQPLNSGVKFQIRSRMPFQRSVFWHEHIGSNQFRLRIHDHDPSNNRQWFTFDRRTQTIRAWARRGYAIANQRGYGYRINVAANIQPYSGSVYQKIRWYNGHYRNIQNNGRKCLDVHGNSDSNHRHLIFYNCHNGRNQRWWLDQVGARYHRPVLADGVKFQLRSRMSGGKALFWHEHIGHNDFRLRIHNHEPWNPRQWFYFDRRTKTIRAASKKNWVISNQSRYQMRVNYAGVIGIYRGHMYQRVSFFPGHYRNVRNAAGLCLDVHGNSNSNHRHTIWYRCHNGANQRWWIDRRGVSYPRYPLNNGVRFQIKTIMPSRRALFWHEHIGHHQYRLRIQNNNPYNVKQWWIFDSRTKTIRSAADRNRVISIQWRHHNWNQNGVAAVARHYRNEVYQRIRWFNGSRRNIRDLGRRCLDVHGNSDSQHRHVIWYKCHNGRNQGWYIDRKGYNYPKYPLRNGVKFQIRSRMSSHRSLFWHEHIGGNQFRLRIRDHDPENNRQWFVFDSRTNTIRALARRNYAIANQRGQGFRIGVAATIQPYSGLNTQKIRWYNGSRRNLQNNGRKCLDVHGKSNSHHRHVIFYNCHNGLNQAWFLDQRAGVYAGQPFGNGIKFQIRNQRGNQRALYVGQHRGGDQYYVRTQDNQPFDNKQWWTFDSRTRSVRSWWKRTHSISNYYTNSHRLNYYVVIRRYSNSSSVRSYQRMTFFRRGNSLTGTFRAPNGKCLSVWGSDTNGRYTFMRDCNSRDSAQIFNIDRKGVHFPRYPLRDGIRFRIRTRMSTGRAVQWHEHIGNGDYRLRIYNNNKYNNRQWWTFNWRTRTIRSIANRNFAISIQYNGKNWRHNGYAATVRHFKGSNLQKIRWFNGSYRNIRDVAGRCLDVHGNSNSNGRHLHWYKCHNGRNQRWYYDTKGHNYPKFPLNNGVRFQIKSRMSTNRALFMAEHIGSNQFRLRIRDNHPGDKMQWFVFDRRSNTIRAWSRRNHALANQRGYQFRRGYAATMRPFDNSNYIRIRWYNGSVRNLRNNGQMCLDVHGNRNYDNRHVIFWTCHNGANQGWFIDQRGETYRRQPFNNGIKFQIRSRMSGNKAAEWTEHIGGHQYRLRLKNVLKPELKQWFTFDHRSRTIRAWSKRNYAVSNQRGQFLRHNRAVVIRQYVSNDSTQRLSYFPGHRNNLRNSGGHCLTPYGNRNHHNIHFIFTNCYNNLSQSYYLDRRDTHFPRYPLRNGQYFQIRSRLSGGRAVSWHEHIGHSQYRLRIQNHSAGNLKQWWTFDWRTRTIRPRSNRNWAMSIQYRGTNWYYYHYAAVVRHFRNEQLQRIRWFNGTYRNVRDLGNRCLDVHGNHNSHRRHLIWYKCHNGSNQRWWIDRRGINYPRQPVSSGVKFQIKSRMQFNRALFWHEHIGANQYRLRIRDNNPTCNKQWFTFDRRTNTIRAWSRRNYAIANQKGYGFRIGVAATIRPYTGDNTERIQWHGGSRRNIRNNGAKCLDVHGKSNTHHRHVIFWNCHNGLNQAWYIDQRGILYRRAPLPNGRKFQIRSRMSTNRALFWHEHIGGHQFRLRIHNNQPFNPRQWWIFDHRTRSVRANGRRNYAISNQRGLNYRIGYAAVIRGWANDHYQRLSFFPGHYRNFRNYAGFCLDVHGGHNHNHRHVTFWGCHNGANQRWYIDQRGVRHPSYPLRNGTKFQIRSVMSTNRALFWREHIGSRQYRLRIQNHMSADERQWWIFDRRSKTIRAHGDRNKIISLRYGYRNWNQNGVMAVARPWRNEPFQQMRWFGGNRRTIRDLGRRCLHAHGNSHLNYVSFYYCSNAQNQGWRIDRTATRFPRYPVHDKTRFAIRSTDN
jgi:hypothetical protein